MLVMYVMYVHARMRTNEKGEAFFERQHDKYTVERNTTVILFPDVL